MADKLKKINNLNELITQTTTARPAKIEETTALSDAQSKGFEIDMSNTFINAFSGLDGVKGRQFTETKNEDGSISYQAVRDPMTFTLNSIGKKNEVMFNARNGAIFSSIISYSASQKTSIIRFPVEEYARDNGKDLSDPKDARIIANDIKDTITKIKKLDITSEYKGKNKLGIPALEHVEIIGSYKIDGTNAMISLDGVFFEHVVKTALPFPVFNPYKLDLQKYPYANAITKYLLMHKNINGNKVGSDALRVENIIKGISLPEYEAIKNGDKNYKKHIILPFLRNLYAPTDVYDNLNIKVEDHDGNIIFNELAQDEDFSKIKIKYADFINLIVRIGFPKGYVDQTKRIANQKKRDRANKQKARRKAKSASSHSIKPSDLTTPTDY